MIGPLGYGRYDEDPDKVGCPRAKSDMTPCIARDGRLALDDDNVCVGCGLSPEVLLDELTQVTGRPSITGDPRRLADRLTRTVRQVTQEPRRRETDGDMDSGRAQGEPR